MAQKTFWLSVHDFLLGSAKIEAAVFQASSKLSERETAHQTPTSSGFAIKQRKKRPQKTWKKPVRRA